MMIVFFVRFYCIVKVEYYVDWIDWKIWNIGDNWFDDDLFGIGFWVIYNGIKGVLFGLIK